MLTKDGMQLRRWMIIALSLLLLISPMAGEVVAQNVDMQDTAASVYAEQYGVDLDTARYRINLQSEIGDLNASLEMKERETFGGLWVEHVPEYNIILRFTNVDSDVFESYREQITFAEHVQLQTGGISLGELTLIHARVAELIDGVKRSNAEIHVDSSLNIPRNRVDVLLEETYGVDWDSIFRAYLPHVEIVKVDALPKPLSEVRAGNFFDGSTCTIGWNVTYAGQRYASSAYHCPAIQYQGNTFATRTGWYGSNVDLEIFYAPTGYTLPNRWQITYPNGWATNLVTVERSKSQTPVGTFVCNIGAGSSTTWRCGSVTSQNYCYNYPGGCNWMQANMYACNGDSGGPVLTDVQAYGMAVGGNCNNSLVYMPLDEFWSRGVHVATSP